MTGIGNRSFTWKTREPTPDQIEVYFAEGEAVVVAMSRSDLMEIDLDSDLRVRADIQSGKVLHGWQLLGGGDIPLSTPGGRLREAFLELVAHGSTSLRPATLVSRGLRRANLIHHGLILRSGRGAPNVCPNSLSLSLTPSLHKRSDCPKFPDAVVLNAVGRRNTQKNAKQRKRAQAQARKKA